MWCIKQGRRLRLSFALVTSMTSIIVSETLSTKQTKTETETETAKRRGTKNPQPNIPRNDTRNRGGWHRARRERETWTREGSTGQETETENRMPTSKEEPRRGVAKWQNTRRMHERERMHDRTNARDRSKRGQAALPRRSEHRERERETGQASREGALATGLSRGSHHHKDERNRAHRNSERTPSRAAAD